MEETKNEGQATASPSDYELAFNLPPTEGMSQIEARKQLARIDNSPDDPYWTDDRLHNEGVAYKLKLQKIVTPGPRIQADQISKALDLRKAGVSEEELSKIPEKLAEVVDEENWSRSVKPLQAEWGNKYEEKMSRVRELVGFGGEAIKSFLDDAEGDTPALGNDPAFVKALDVVAELIQRQQEKLAESRRYKSQMKKK